MLPELNGIDAIWSVANRRLPYWNLQVNICTVFIQILCSFCQFSTRFIWYGNPAPFESFQFRSSERFLQSFGIRNPVELLQTKILSIFCNDPEKTSNFELGFAGNCNFSVIFNWKVVQRLDSKPPRGSKSLKSPKIDVCFWECRLKENFKVRNTELSF